MAIGSLSQWTPYYDNRGGVRLDTPHARASITILDTESLSEEIDMGGYILLKFVIPSGFPGAFLTFQSSLHGDSDYQNVRFEGAELSLAVVAGENTIIPPDIALSLYPFIKIRSGTSGSPSVMTSDTEIEILGILP